MKNIISILGLAVLGFLVHSCEEDEIEQYQESPTVYFSEYSRTYTFAENLDKLNAGFDTIRLPLQISGSATDYDREVAMEVVSDDSLHTAEENMFNIGKGSIPANMFKGHIPLRVNYTPALDDSIYYIRVRLVPTTDFPAVDLEEHKFTISLTNKMTEPSNWHRIRRYFGPYSNSWYRFILETTGLTSIPYWSYNGSADPRNPDPDRWTMSLYELKAYVNLVKEKLDMYNRKHPHDHLKHLDGPEEGKEVVMP